MAYYFSDSLFYKKLSLYSSFWAKQSEVEPVGQQRKLLESLTPTVIKLLLDTSANLYHTLLTAYNCFITCAYCTKDWDWSTPTHKNLYGYFAQTFIFFKKSISYNRSQNSTKSDFCP